MVLKLYGGVSFQLQTFLHQCNIQTELLLSQQALQNPLCRKYFDKYLAEWGAVLMCPLQWDDVGIDFCYCEFTHPFLWFKVGAAHTSVWLERRAGWGWCLGGNLKPTVFSSGGGCWIRHVSHMQWVNFGGREQKV